MIEKDKIVLKDSLMPCLYAVRHGNGRDWWLIAQNSPQTEILVFLVDKKGVQLKNKQKIGEGYKDTDGIGQIVVSPDGKKLAWFHAYSWDKDGFGFSFADFDRCSDCRWRAVFDLAGRDFGGD